LQEERAKYGVGEGQAQHPPGGVGATDTVGVRVEVTVKRLLTATFVYESLEKSLSS
jgi:hypothetical protein